MREKKSKIETYLPAVIRALSVLLFFLVIAVNFIDPIILLIRHEASDKGQQFSYLAESFLQGKLYFTQALDWTGEPSFFHGRAYYALGPFPAVLLMPFVAITHNYFLFYQGFLSVPILILTGYVVYKISKRLGFTKQEARLLVCSFCFASPLIFVAIFPISNFLAHIVVVALFSLVFLEYFEKKRLWLIGLLFGLILATRFTAGLGIIFFILMVLYGAMPIREKVKKLSQLLAPFVIFALLLALYNWLRFGDILETGYAFQSLPYQFQADIRDQGLYGWNHFLRNAYHMFFGLPLEIGRSYVPLFWNNPHGVSIFLTSMYLLYFFKFKKYEREEKFLILTSAIIALPLLLSWSSGFYQIGYRFALDFFPLIFFALLLALKRQYGKVPRGFFVLTSCSLLFNYYLLVIAAVESIQTR